MSGTKEPRSGFLLKSMDLAGKVGQKTLELAKIAKLTLEINSEKERVRNAQLEIGKTYYESFSDDAHPLLKDCCSRIKESLEIIENKKQSINDLSSKNANTESDDSFD